MKARVKATGEIVELCNMEYDKDGNEYYRDELELIGDYEPDYWEKLKHQYAGMMLAGMLANSEWEGTYENLSEYAIKAATVLINRLKEEKK